MWHRTACGAWCGIDVVWVLITQLLAPAQPSILDERDGDLKEQTTYYASFKDQVELACLTNRI